MPLFGSSSKSQALQPAPPGEGQDVPIRHEELVLAAEPYSAQAEQFRRLRNSVQALNPDGASRTVLFTSAAEGEGKTVACLNLGLAMSELPGLRVLVVDTDALSPSVEEYLNVPRRQGLFELLAGTVTVEQAIRGTSVERFDIMGCGEPPVTPALNIDRMRAVLNALKRRYDYVLLDGPAVLNANQPSVLGSLVDGVLLAVRMGRTPKQQVEEAFQMLENLGGNVLGLCALGLENG